MLERKGEQVRRLLLRTCLVERISGGLTDALTGGSGGERILQDLEAANAFVVALDAARSWFRYHGCSPACCSWSGAAPPRVRSPGCPLGWGDSRLLWVGPTTNRHGLASRLTGMSV